jgi:hypothetical protein
VKHVRSGYFLALVVVTGACSASATGNEAFVTVTNAYTPADGLPAATEWCAKYGKIPRHSSSTRTNIQNYDCVPRT